MKRKRTILLTAALIAAMAGGCGSSGSDTAAEEEAAVEETAGQTTKEADDEIDLKDYLDIGDMYVRQNSENVDFKKLATIKKGKEDIVKEIKVDDSKVDLEKVGKYEAVYTVTLSLPDGEASKTDTTGSDTQTDSEASSDETEAAKAENTSDKTAAEKKIAVKETVTIEVVGKDKAKKLAKAGKTVIVNDNKMLAKDGESIEETADTADTVTPAQESAQAGETAQASAQAQASGGGNAQPTYTASGSSAPSQPAGCSHNWVQHYTTVTDYQTVIDYQTVTDYTWEGHCICYTHGDQGTEGKACRALGCHDGYYVKSVQVPCGSHQEAVGSHQEAVGSHQEADYQYCTICGATR